MKEEQPGMLTDEELHRLTEQVEEQLAALPEWSPAPSTMRGPQHDSASPPPLPAQKKMIEEATGEPFETFWAKYRRHLRRDLCLPGGMLHEQWRKWRDLESKAVVRSSYGWVAAMGIPFGSLAPATVAASVIVLNIVIKVGIDAICEGCEEES